VRARIAALLIGALAMAIVPAGAQEPVINRPPDTLKTDSLRARRDTLSPTERLLQAQKNVRVQIEPLPTACGMSLQPAGARIVLTRDSIDWAPALDLGELLSRVPGVTLERGDWFGGPVQLNYLGHGAASVEYVLDCVPQVAIGADSVAYDPVPLPLGYLDRVEVETTASSMRVFLFTRRHDRKAPRTKIGTGQGDRGAAHYFGSFEQRGMTGVGVSVAADYLALNRVPGGTGGQNIPGGWIQLGYAPTSRFGVQGQVIIRSITRNLLLDELTNDTLSREMKGNRSDAQLRVSWRSRADLLGSSLNLFGARTSWSSDSAPGHEAIAQFGGIYSLRHPTWSAELAAWHSSRWTPLDSRLDLGWSPTPWITGSVQLVAQRHDGDRRSQWATGRVGITLPLGFHVGGVVSDGHRAQAPELAAVRVLAMNGREDYHCDRKGY